MKIQYKILLSIIVLAVTYSVGYYTGPMRIKTKEIVKTVVKKEEAKTKIVYRDRIIYKDGTIVEKEVEREDTKTTENTEQTKLSQKNEVKDAGLVLSLLGTVNLADIETSREYSVIASKRVLGALNVTGGVGVNEKGNIKVSLGGGWSF